MFQADNLGCQVLKESCDFNLLSTFSLEIIKDVFSWIQVRFEKEPLQVKEQDTCKEEILQIQKSIRIRRRKLWR